jgi:hypothetical protein
MKKLIPSLGFTWRPENLSTARNTKTQPSRWRTARAAVALGVLALCTTIANAQLQWISADVGGPTFHGSAVEANGQWTIQGGGSDIWNDSSQFHYLYVWASGMNWDITAQFVSFQGPADWSKVELMVDQADPTVGPQGTDPFIAMMDTQPSTYAAPDGSGNGVNDGGIDQWRSTANSASDWKQVGVTPAPNYPNDWFRIQRQTNVFNLFHSGDGINWTNYISIDTSSKALIGQDASTTFGTPWPNLVCVGVAVTAHNDTYTDPDTGLPAGATAVVANLNTTNIAAATPPTLIAASQQSIISVTNVVGHEVSLMFAATNNATPAPAAYPTIYQWYKNNSAVPNATNTLYTWLLDVSDNGAKYYCKASLAAPYNALTVNSATATFGTVPGVTYNNGFKMEMFAGVTDRTLVERGDVPPCTWLKLEPNCDDPGGYGNNYVTRISGWFIPPTTDKYFFFLATDDDSDLFLNMTNSTIAGKQMIAQEVGWTGFDDWFSDSSTPSQQSSQTWADVNGNSPWTLGIPLTAGQPYYIENVHHQGGGGDNICITYQTAAMETSGGGTFPNTIFANGTNSLFYGTNNNMRYYSIPDTTLTWVTQPTNAEVSVGFSANFYSQAKSDSEFTPVYQWFKNGARVSGPSPAAANFSTGNTVAGDNGSQIYVVVTTAEGDLSLTSAVVTLNVATPVLEYGWAKMEYWYANDIGLAPFLAANGTNYVNAATTSPDYLLYEPRFEGNSQDNNLTPDYTSRLTALFYPPATGEYVFFVNSDDQSDLFVSTDSSPTNATLVAQETGWSNPWQWTTGNGASTAAEKCSATWAAPNGGTPWATGIYLNANTPYYVVLMHVDTGGGNNCEATFMSLSAWNALGGAGYGPALGSYSAMTGNLIGSYVPRCFSMAFTQEPTTAMAPIGGVATFTAAGATDSRNAVGDEGNSLVETNNFVVYQWTKNGVPIAGANGSSYSFGPVYPLDTNAQFACTIRALGYQNSSGQDLWATSTVVNVVLTGTNVFEPGFALHEFYQLDPPMANIANGSAGAPTWSMSSPAFEVDILGTDALHGGTYDNFSDQLIGFFTPPTSGNYVFFLNSDDNGELFLSTDASASDKRMIAQETGWGSGVLEWGQSAGTASQVRSDTFVDPATGATLYSNGIPLVAGKQYFMQAVHEQGGGGTYTCVTWVLTPGANNPPAAPANGTLSVIRGNQIGTYVPKCSYVTVTTQPQSVTVNNYASATFTTGGATDSTVPMGSEGDWTLFFNNYLEYQWYKNNTPIAGATASAYTDSPILPSDNNAKIYCTMRALGYADNSGNILWQTSQVASVTVNITAPTLLYGAIYTNNNYANFPPAVATNYIILAFSNPMDPGALSNMGSYTLPPGLTLLGVMVNSNDYRSVALAYSGTPTFPFNVTVSSSLAGLGGGPTLSGSTSIAVDKVPLTDMDIGQIPGTDPAVPGMMYVTGTNSYTIACEGSDIWNTYDGFNFAYEQKTGDFDVCVRVKDVKHTSNWSKAGLMVRETLDADSRNWNIVNDPASADGIMAPDNSGYGANAIECNARVDKTGASAAWTTNDVSAVPAYPNAWVRLTRVGNILTAYFSTNNAATWTAAATNDPAVVSTTGAGELPATVYVGICTTAHNNDAIPNPSPLVYLDTVDYANYGAPPAPPQIITIGAPTVSNGKINITWTPAVGRLLGSPALTGPNVDWVQVGTGGSASIPTTGTGQFFRVVNP